jgi:methionyl-tRNA formyltransferase
MDSKKLRIVFMGTPDFAVGVLRRLVKEKYQVISVVTAVDKPAGRGKKLRKSAVKEFAENADISVYQPSNLKDHTFVDSLKTLKADLFIVVAFRMLPKVVWELPKMGTFNLHASLLPAYRGAAPINWAVINGEYETGVTTFFIDEKIDTGEIILQEKIEILSCDTAGVVHDKLQELGAGLVLKTVDLIAIQNFKTSKQSDSLNSKAPKLNKENTLINWNDSLISIYNKVRGLSPYPASWSRFVSDKKEYTFKLYMSNPEYVKHSNSIGSIIVVEKKIKIAVKEGYLVIDQLQLSGKKRMDAKSLLNGFHFSKDARVLI